MRWNDLNDGSIKTLLIFGLIVANLVVASFPHPRQAPAPRARSEMTKSE